MRAAGGVLPPIAAATPTARLSLERGRDLLGRRAAARGVEASLARRPTTPTTRWRPPPPRSRWASRPMPCARGCASFGGVPHRLERVAEIDGVVLRQRLQGHQRRRGGGGAALLRRRGPRDPRRLAEGGVVRGPRRARVGALRRLLPDRRGGRAARARPRARRATPGSSCAAAGGLEDAVRAAADGAGPGEVVLLAPACASFDAYRDFEAARRALPRRSWSRCGEPRCRRAQRARGASREGRARPRRAPAPPAPADRVLAAAHRDAVPARLRGGDGVQRQLDDLAAGGERRRRLLPEAHLLFGGVGPARDADASRCAGCAAAAAADARCCSRSRSAARRGAGPGRRTRGQRRAALDRRRACSRSSPRSSPSSR